MPLSQVQICNLALSRIGITQFIESIDEASPEAKACKMLFDPCLQDLLTSHDWPFADREAELALVAEDPTPEWSFSYRLPADCLKAQRITNAEGIDYAIASDASGGLLYCNAEEVTLQYTANIDDIGIIPVDVAWALVGMLSKELANSFGRNDSVIERARQWAQQKLMDAIALRLNEPQREDPPEAEAISERE
jgi:hypothetical protein